MMLLPRHIARVPAPLRFESMRHRCVLVQATILTILCGISAGSAIAQDREPHETTPAVRDTVALPGHDNPADASPEGEPRKRDPRYFESAIRPLLRRACFDCHSGEDVEGNFRMDQLDPDLVGGADFAWWLEAYAVLSNGEMPPADSSELSDADRTRLVDWLSGQIQEAEKRRKSRGDRSSFRRLTRYEYDYALQDLFGVPWSFAGDLPIEASEEDGFENNAESMHLSVKQLQTYHQLALTALRRVTVEGERPETLNWSISMSQAFHREIAGQDRNIESTKKKFAGMPDKQAEQIAQLERQFQASADRSHYIDLETGRRAKIEWNYRKAVYAFGVSETHGPMPEPGSHFAVVFPGSSQSLTVELGDRLPDQGTMRVRVRASRAKGAKTTIPSLQLHFGFQATDQGRSIKRVSRQDVPVRAAFGHPEIYQWEIPLGEIEHRNTYRGEMKLGDQPSPSEYIRFTNSTDSRGGPDAESPAILIDQIEVAAPVYDQWPPRSHRRVFIESHNADDENSYAREIIASWMTHAWRRPPAPRDVDRKMQLFQTLRPEASSFQESILDVLATILTSPKFLYVLPGDQDTSQDLRPDRLSQHELATRLSLFLWCSLPDETLLTLASEGRLDDPEILQQQVNRMLADPRSERFCERFVQQWLKMRPLEYLRPTRGADGIDESLLESIKREPIALFVEMLEKDSDVLEFIDSDYVMINARLARHYGLPAVQGNHFRRTSLPADVNRGGLLTQAGLLTMNSDGEDSHPVKRGVWLLTSLLNDPPPPPPPAVPEIDLSDPNIAKLTLKEQIEDHRNQAACLSCHQKIDPWGIAFENYDARGRWRDRIDGKAVDATSELPGHVNLDGMRGLKQHLLQDRREKFLIATLEQLASFSMGRRLGLGDRADVAEILHGVHDSGDGLRTMVTHLVMSDLFRSR